MSEPERLAKAFRKWQSENMGKDIALSLVPGVGQIYGMGSAIASYIDPEASKVERGLQSLSFVPFGSLAKLRNANKIVAGEKGARNVPSAIDELDYAKQMFDDAGQVATPQLNQQIFRETGWWKDPTTYKWMREFGDEFSTPKLEPFARAAVRSHADTLVNVDDALDHSTLYTLYPGFKRMTQRLKSNEPTSEGFFDVDVPEISGGVGDYMTSPRALSNVRDTQLHEIQHAIAAHEGFALGSSPASAGSYEAYLRDPGEILARVAALRRNLTTAGRQKLPFYRHMMEEEGRLMQPGQSSRYAKQDELKRLLGERNLEWQDFMYPNP